MPAMRKSEEPAGRRDNPREFAIGTLTATNARLTILPRNPEKDPKVFDIFSLEVLDLTLLTPSQFTVVDGKVKLSLTAEQAKALPKIEKK